QLTAAFDRQRLGADRRQLGPAVAIAHADEKEAFALGDARQDLLALRRVAEAQDERPALPVGDPMRAHRRPCRKQLLCDDIALQEALLLPAICLGPGHADPAARSQALAEFRRMAGGEIAFRAPAPGRFFLGDEAAYL